MKDFIKKFAREISVFGLVLVVFLGLFIGTLTVAEPLI